MSTYIENLFIFLFCSFIYPVTNFTVPSLLFILLAFILNCFLVSIKNEKIRSGIVITTLVISFIYNNFSCFLPAILYQSFRQKRYLLSGMGVFLTLYFNRNEPQHIAILSAVFLVSFYLAGRSYEREKLQTTILRQRDNSVEQEMMLNRKNEQLLAVQNEEIFVATLKERNRIAREIHDNVGHTLSRSILQVGALLAICKDEVTKTHLAELKNSLDDAMNNIRNSVHDLHDESIDLRASLQNLVDGFTFCKISFNCDISKNVPKDIKYCFIAITKEALNNIIKHSNATDVNVTVIEHPGLYQLLIADNGTATFSENKDGGIGLSNMRDRVNALNGILHITSKNGVKIFVTVPKNRREITNESSFNRR